MPEKKVENSSCYLTAIYGKGESLAMQKARLALRRHQIGLRRARREVFRLEAEERK